MNACRPAELRIGTIEVGCRTILIPIGEIDLSTLGALRAHLAMHDGDVVVDLEHVELLDAGGVGALVGARQRLVDGGGSLELWSPQPAVRRVLDVLGLAGWLTPVSPPRVAA
jgi:anti-sigma B factor antagonist